MKDKMSFVDWLLLLFWPSLLGFYLLLGIGCCFSGAQHEPEVWLFHIDFFPYD